MASSIKCSLSLQQRQLSYHPILICLEGLLPAVSYWFCCMTICSGFFPSSFTLPQTVFFWLTPVFLGRLSDPLHQTTREQLVCEMNFSAASKEPQASVWLCPQQSEWNCNFCSSNLFCLCLKSGLFSQNNPYSASTLRKHSWRLWNRLICLWRLITDWWSPCSFIPVGCLLKSDATSPYVT